MEKCVCKGGGRWGGGYRGIRMEMQAKKRGSLLIGGVGDVCDIVGLSLLPSNNNTAGWMWSERRQRER